MVLSPFPHTLNVEGTLEVVRVTEHPSTLAIQFARLPAGFLRAKRLTVPVPTIRDEQLIAV